jgi:hypothetical protein
LRAQKLREEAAEKEKDECFNTIWSVIPMKQEWRVKEKANTPASNDDMDLLDDDVFVDQWRVSATDWYGHQYGVHVAGRVQRCRIGGHSDMSRS